MRGDNSIAPNSGSRVATARIVDLQGNVHFHVVSTWWSRGIIIGFALLIAMVIVMSLLILKTRRDIDYLQHQVDTGETNVNTRVTNTNTGTQ